MRAADPVLGIVDLVAEGAPHAHHDEHDAADADARARRGPSTIGPPGIDSSPRLASSAASSVSTRAPSATDAAIRPRAMKIDRLTPRPDAPAPLARRSPGASSDGARDQDALEQLPDARAPTA